ncbi:Myc-type, basic helix-loop-helix (bHLH) domain [Dillenia turbinata]|uniref:Myc-type, basic helix-loop-helix (BHLH) domain n=1 Tax=Dillenia turbinata TaxID=194707 RepID=A0AAN8Z9D6_9MAGN
MASDDQSISTSKLFTTNCGTLHHSTPLDVCSSDIFGDLPNVVTLPPLHPDLRVFKVNDVLNDSNVGVSSFQTEKFVELEAKRVSNRHERVSRRQNRHAELRNITEKKRRVKINEKMRILQGLIPNCTKQSMQSTLD